MSAPGGTKELTSTRLPPTFLVRSASTVVVATTLIEDVGLPVTNAVVGDESEVAAAAQETVRIAKPAVRRKIIDAGAGFFSLPG